MSKRPGPVASGTRGRRTPAPEGGPAIELAEAGRLALAAGRFQDACRSFEAALGELEMAESYEGLGWASIWREDVPQGIACFEDAHRAYLAEGNPRGAGRAALWLAYAHGYVREEPAIAGGWVDRATRLLEGLSPGPEHVWLATSLVALRGEDPEQSRQLASDAAEIGRRLARPELEAMGLANEGLLLVSEGRATEGIRLLDEAAATAIASDSSDFAAVGHTCCAMLAACELTGDLARASEWCERTTAYATKYGFRPLQATCRTSYAGVLIARGHWRDAEVELMRADEQFAASRPAARGAAIVRLAELRRRQGRFSEASELFARAGASGRALLGCADLSLDRGDAERAADLAERYLRQAPSAERAIRAVALELLARACVACSRSNDAEAAVEELREIAAELPGEQLLALTRSAEASLAATEGEADRARGLLEDAVDLFDRCGAPLEAARARLDLARALRAGGKPGADEEARAARDAFARLGAAYELERAARFQTLLERVEAPTTDGAPQLTRREREVLILIATGLTNREIATRLVISEHTVHRHATNLYRKLDVSSRAAATAFAYSHGLVPTGAGSPAGR